MINKFQQGGTTQQGSILQQIQQLPEDQQKQLMQNFTKWAQQKGIDVQQLQNNPQALEQALGQFIQEIQQQQKLQAARHGIKLQYIKKLKHQCADDEELYYYKKGGSIDCGCKKKGGEVVKANMGVVANFKEDQKKKQQQKMQAWI